MLRAIPALVFCALLTGGAQKPLLVSAAISRTDALREVATAYAAAGGGTVEFNFAGSNVLARQIANGAPADLFISADETQMTYALQRGAIDAPSYVVLLTNRLAVVTPLGRERPPTNSRGLLDSGIRRIAIGDPAAVPAGVYAKRYLEAAGLWKVLQPKLLPLANVRAALAAAASGGADAAVVYESDVTRSSRVRLAFIIDDEHAPLIVYPGAVTKASKHPEARRFLAYLGRAEARRIFERYKFSTPDGR